MLDLSLYALDIAQNSVTAGANMIRLTLIREGEFTVFEVKDDGCGMSPEFLARVTDPFTTTRKTRKVGLGLPFLKQLAEQTGGSFRIESEAGKGTAVRAEFKTGHIDMIPLGDIGETVVTLIQGSPCIRWVFTLTDEDGETNVIDTDEM